MNAFFLVIRAILLIVIESQVFAGQPFAGVRSSTIFHSSRNPYAPFQDLGLKIGYNFENYRLKLGIVSGKYTLDSGSVNLKTKNFDRSLVSYDSNFVDISLELNIASNDDNTAILFIQFERSLYSQGKLKVRFVRNRESRDYEMELIQKYFGIGLVFAIELIKNFKLFQEFKIIDGDSVLEDEQKWEFSLFGASFGGGLVYHF